MIEEDMEVAVKVLIVGNGAVGKSSLIQRYCKGIYTNEYKKTIGVDFLEKQITIQEYNLRLMIWDTAGQEEFDSITRAYYRDAAACVVAFSTTDRDSFGAVESWIKKVEDEVGSIPMVLIQNKSDLIKEAVMTKEEAEALARKVQLKFYRVSVQENYNVDSVFEYLADLYIKRLKEREAEAPTLAGQQIAQGSAPPPSARVDFSAKKGGFKIEPKRRTGGKKSKFDCVLL
eukprot:m.24266 g.24266  ORF g.24266 m.24266 type:complete len:230 (+) comp11170_c0_seq1:68-757(+)